LITLETKIHDEFNKLRIGLCPTQNNTYKLLNLSSISIDANHPDVKSHETGQIEITLSNHFKPKDDDPGPSVFKGPSGSLLDDESNVVRLPDPLSLEAHSTCVRILNCSGHFDLVQRVIKEDEDERKMAV